MSIPAIDDATRDSIRASLLNWATDVDKPMIPAYRDGDDDGHPDFYALDAFGRVIVIDAGDPVFAGYTNVAESTGDGIETGGS